uniref:Photosystem II protein I n=1 Tax=Oryza coarctata TaxID=77588 RepID=A0A2I6C0F9_ORYCO|nr:photosystem II protein I [Oryza coarctata]AUJ21981.1 photosystem II protein I [Oryza coarctata]
MLTLKLFVYTVVIFFVSSLSLDFIQRPRTQSWARRV